MSSIKTAIRHSLNNDGDTLDGEFQSILEHKSIISPPLSAGPVVSWDDFRLANGGAILTADNCDVELGAEGQVGSRLVGNALNDALDPALNNQGPQIDNVTPFVTYALTFNLRTSVLGDFDLVENNMTIDVNLRIAGSVFGVSCRQSLLGKFNTNPVSDDVGVAYGSSWQVSSLSGFNDADWLPNASAINAAGGLSVAIWAFGLAGGSTEVDGVAVTFNSV